jgi:NodT family efflux transporter outer membrane factor (OMF) lipoprotein
MESARHQLEILLGRYPAGKLTLGTTLPEPAGAIPAGLPSGLLERRPDLVAARRRLEAADWRVSEARAGLFPRISLTAAGGTSTEELSDLLDSDFKVWNLAANLAQPIFEGGRLRAGVDLSKAQTREALAAYQAAALRAFGEVETALGAERHLARREKELENAATQYGAALRLAKMRYDAGLDTFITYLDVQRRSLEVEVQWVSIRRARLDNRVDLHLALSGGFDPVAGEHHSDSTHETNP